jgi:hypothetical protein
VNVQGAAEEVVRSRVEELDSAAALLELAAAEEEDSRSELAELAAEDAELLKKDRESDNVRQMRKEVRKKDEVAGVLTLLAW